MSLENKLFTLVSNSREDARRQVVEEFLEEHCGEGKGEHCSKYEYEVEQYKEYKVILKRPANLNKGFDFTVNIKGIYFKNGRRHTNPSHNDIISVLNKVKDNIGDTKYNLVSDIIWKIFKLEDYSSDLQEISNIFFLDCDDAERPVVVILLAIRWLFIEQDITYWNWSGRSMLMNALLGEGLVT